MTPDKITPQELWSRQQITSRDVDYEFWNRKRNSIQEFSLISRSCIFMVDVFKKRYDFASENFSRLFGYNPAWIETIREQGDMLEERIHPDDRAQLMKYQIEHGQFIYSLPPENRNDYQQIFQIRILNTKHQYVNVVSRHQVLQQDRNGKAWIVMGAMDISPDQVLSEKVKRTVINKKTGEIIIPTFFSENTQLTPREVEILSLIHKGFISKKIAHMLQISIYTVNNHRKSIFAKLNASNVVEAINVARDSGIIH